MVAAASGFTPSAIAMRPMMPSIRESLSFSLPLPRGSRESRAAKTTVFPWPSHSSILISTSCSGTRVSKGAMKAHGKDRTWLSVKVDASLIQSRFPTKMRTSSISQQMPFPGSAMKFSIRCMDEVMSICSCVLACSTIARPEEARQIRRRCSILADQQERTKYVLAGGFSETDELEKSLACELVSKQFVVGDHRLAVGKGACKASGVELNARRNQKGGLEAIPVLSKSTTLTLCALSRCRPPLIRTPFCAPTPVPTMMAVGVARPSAQGQAVIIPMA